MSRTDHYPYDSADCVSKGRSKGVHAAPRARSWTRRLGVVTVSCDEAGCAMSQVYANAEAFRNALEDRLRTVELRFRPNARTTSDIDL